MSAFGSISLANKFGIVLGCLVAVAFGAGLGKLWWNKRRLRKHTKLADEEAAKGQRHLQGNARRDDDPRYLFGVRAIERGYFGGVAQTRSISSLGSLVDSGNSASQPNKTGESNHTLPHSNLAITSEKQQIRRKPTPLRLQPVDISMTEKHSPSPISPDSDYIVLPASHVVQIDSVDRAIPVVEEPEDSRNLLHVAPEANSDRPISFLPRFNFPEPLRENLGPNLYVPTPSNSVKNRKSRRTSSKNHPVLPKVVEQPSTSGNSSPSYSAFPPIPIPPRSKLRAQRSIFPQEDRERAHSRRPSNFGPPPPIPETYNVRRPRRSDELAFRKADPITETEGSVIQFANRRKSSDAISLAALTGTPVVATFPRPPPSPPSSDPEDQLDPRGRPISSSSRSRARKSSSHTVARARDSIYRPRSTSASKRRSVQRDVLHYDPRSHHRDRSGSIQGRPVDFSQPRESPFSDLAAVSTKGHTPNTSTSSDNSIISFYTTPRSEQPSLASYKMTTAAASVESTSGSDVPGLSSKGGSRLRDTLDNFGTKHMTVPAPIADDDSKVSRTSIIDSKLASQLREHRTHAKHGVNLSISKVERRKPQRVSSDGEEWSLSQPGVVSFETHSTSTSPVRASPGFGEERFPKFARI